MIKVKCRFGSSRYELRASVTITIKKRDNLSINCNIRSTIDLKRTLIKEESVVAWINDRKTT